MSSVLQADPTRSTPVVGLSSSEAGRRLAEFGPNAIQREQATSPIALLLRQFTSPVIWLLLGAAIISALFGEFLDAGAIGAIVLVNAAIGFFQEHRAERAVMALRSMTAPRARVRRDGHSLMIPASTVVPGDLLLLEAGDVAAADARLHTAHALTTNEAPLTGESAPVAKDTSPTGAGTPLAERHDFVFMGTSVTTGTGLAEVVATGMQTELGRIAHLLATAEETGDASTAAAGEGQSDTALPLRRHCRRRCCSLDCCADGRSCRCSWQRCPWPWPRCRRGCPRSSRLPSQLACNAWQRAMCWSAACQPWRHWAARP